MARRVEATPNTKLPRYEERYIGRFRNKVEWVRTLRAHQYKFYNLLQEHLTHMPHEALLSDPNDPDTKTMKNLMFAVDDNRVQEVSKTLRTHQKLQQGQYEDGWHCRL